VVLSSSSLVQFPLFRQLGPKTSRSARAIPSLALFKVLADLVTLTDRIVSWCYPRSFRPTSYQGPPTTYWRLFGLFALPSPLFSPSKSRLFRLSPPLSPAHIATSPRRSTPGLIKCLCSLIPSKMSVMILLSHPCVSDPSYIGHVFAPAPMVKAYRYGSLSYFCFD